ASIPAHMVSPKSPIAAPVGTPAGTATKPLTSSAPAAPAVPSQVVCTAPAELARFERPLLHTMRRLANGQPLTIVAIGSSSTAGGRRRRGSDRSAIRAGGACQVGNTRHA